MTTTAAPADRRAPVARDGGWLDRVEVVTPAMCGHNSLFIGQLGDWTWDAVGATCGIDPYRALDAGGDPAYLSFSYFRVHCDTGFTPQQIGFGDRLAVSSKVFSAGGDSLLTVHAVGRDDALPGPDDVNEFFARRRPDTIHVENFNRWITRAAHESNHGLRRAAPIGFDGRALPRVPDQWSPRRTYTQARGRGTLATPDDGEPQHRLVLDYPVEASRDLNGAGLLYFATYFSIVDWGLLRLWQSLGRDATAFLGRETLDHQLCFLRNADADDILRVGMAAYEDDAGFVVHTALSDRATGGVVAVSRQRIRDNPADESSQQSTHKEAAR